MREFPPEVLERAKKAWEIYEKTKNTRIIEESLLEPLMVFAYYRKPSLFPPLLDRYAKQKWSQVPDKKQYLKEQGLNFEDGFISVPEFLTYFYEQPLYYREVKKGKVRIYIEEDGLLMLKHRIKEDIKKVPREWFNKMFKDWRTQTEVKILKTSSHPPCIEAILEKIKKGNNIGHYERLALGLYFVNLKMPIDDIVELFRPLPNFKEKTTRYHLEFIKEKGYKMYSCSKMRELKLCVADCGITHPMEWHYGKKNKKIL